MTGYEEILDKIDTLKDKLRAIEQDIIDDHIVDSDLYKSLIRQLFYAKLKRDIMEDIEIELEADKNE